VNPLLGLLCSIGIEFDSVVKHLTVTGDGFERNAIADAGVNGGRRIWKAQEATNSLGFGEWQRVKAESAFALKSQGRTPFSEKRDQLSQ
jgi:hypothetical protein